MSLKKISKRNSNCKVMTIISDKRKVSLKEKFENYSYKNLTKKFDWGNPIGKEIW